MKKFISKSITLLMAIASAGMLSACLDDKVAGGVTEDAGLAIRDLDVAGLAQKGPFVKGSVVTVQGVDCKTMKFTEEEFTGKVKSNKGDFGVDDVNLSATCALFSVSGYYMNEFTGEQSSDKLTLHAITDLKDRKHVNINVLTELEYERVMKLVSKEKMSFDDAKMQAEKEILTALGLVDRFESFEGLNIYEKGDGNATLLATSVTLQADLDAEKLTERLDGFASSITESGEWDDEKTKKEMADWADSAKSDGKYETIRDNLEKWSDSDEILEVEKDVDEINKDADKNAKDSTQKIPEGWSWDVPQSARLNPNIKYDTMIDPRDKQVYKIVKIEVKDQDYSHVWMAENLNYADSVKTPSLKGRNWCYKGEEKNCKVSGRYYSWSAAIDSVALANDPKDPLDCGYGKTCGLNRGVQGICPDGWHLPTIHEWGLLSVALGNAGVSGGHLKALTGWNYAGTDDNNGTDDYGFAALPTGRRLSATSWGKVGTDVYYWSSDELDAYEGQYSNINNIYTKFYIYHGEKTYGQSVRCIKGDASTAAIKSSSSSSVVEAKSSSSSVAKSSSSGVSTGWSWDVPKEKRLNPNIKYDSIVDSRDKRVYKVVKIEVKEHDYSKVWMAENLNYADSVKTPSLKGNSWCYHDTTKYCEVGGRYYTWAAAIDSVALANDSKEPLDCGYGKTCGLDRQIQGICPDGWHLPSNDEWGKLSVALGNAGVSGDSLKALTGWNYAGTDDNNGQDAYGFSALPTGRRISETSWEKVGSDVYYWSSNEYSESYARYSNINNIYTKFYLYQNSKKYGQSIRCVKN